MHPCPHARKDDDMNNPNDKKQPCYFPLWDVSPVPRSDLESLGLHREKDGTLRDAVGKKVHPSRIKAVLTGEKRPPRKGEWFLSRISLRAHLATEDLVGEEKIIRLVLVSPGRSSR
jgi:hypothetical protein